MGRIGIEKPMHVHDEVSHQRVVDRALRGTFPGHMRLGIVRVDADNVEPLEVPELHPVERFEFAPENQVQELLHLSSAFAAHPSLRFAISAGWPSAVAPPREMAVLQGSAQSGRWSPEWALGTARYRCGLPVAQAVAFASV